jgi:hypothetical protein
VNLANAAFFAFMAARMSSTAPTNSFMPSTKISTKEEEKRNTLHNPEVRQSVMIDTRNNEKDGRVVLQAAYSVEMHAWFAPEIVENPQPRLRTTELEVRLDAAPTSVEARLLQQNLWIGCVMLMLFPAAWPWLAVHYVAEKLALRSWYEVSSLLLAPLVDRQPLGIWVRS